MKSKLFLTLFTFISNLNFCQIHRQNNYEFGLRVCSIYKNVGQVSFFNQDQGVLLFDGFLFLVNRSNFGYRFQFNYHTSNQNIYPYYEFLPKDLAYHDVKIIDCSFGVNKNLKFPGFYLFSDIFYAYRNKVGSLYGNIVPIFDLDIKRDEAGLFSGLGFKQRFAKVLVFRMEYRFGAFYQKLQYQIKNVGTGEIYKGDEGKVKFSNGMQVFFTIRI